MKKQILYLIAGLAILFTACDPIEDRNSAGPVLSEDELLSNVSISVDGNNVTLENTAPEVISFWKTNFGQQSNQNKVTFYIPLQNTYTATLTAYCAGGPVTIEKQFEIAQNDPEYFADQFWLLLTNGPDGKSWVWATDFPGGKVWGIGPYLASTSGDWWSPAVADLPGQGASLTDEVVFDLNLGLNFKVINSEGTTEDPTVPGNGSGTFNMSLGAANQIMNADGNAIWSYGKIVFTNHTIPLGFEPNTSGKPLHYKYDILKLTNDELWLAFPEPGVTGAWGSCWFYKFKRKGYSY